jgi:hypothetical protein
MQLVVTYDPLGTPDPHLVYEGPSIDSMRDAMVAWMTERGDPEDHQARVLRWFDGVRKYIVKGKEPELNIFKDETSLEKWKVLQVVGS